MPSVKGCGRNRRIGCEIVSTQTIPINVGPITRDMLARIAQLEREISAIRKIVPNITGWFPKNANPTALVAMKAVCDEFQCTPNEVLMRTNIPRYVAMRRLLIRLLRDTCSYSFPMIAKLVHKHHTTVMYHYDMARENPEQAEQYARVAQQFVEPAVVQPIPVQSVSGARAL